MLKPRWLGLLAFVIVVMITFGLLGLWQLNVARDKGQAEAIKAAPTRPVAALSTVLQPNAAFPVDGSGRRITATGRYDAAEQLLVTPRRLHGRTGYWVLTPLVLEGTGARIAVMRGFVTEPGQATRPPADTAVTVSGTLAPGESPADSASALPPGQIGTIDMSVLVNMWHGPVYNAFVFATGEQPDVTAASGPQIQRVPPPPLIGGGLAWRNAAYALQWWVFALFAAYMWWRMVRDDAQEQDHENAEPATAGEATINV